MSTLITAGAIACETFVNSAGADSEETSSENITNSGQTSHGSVANCEQPIFDSVPDTQPQNYKSLADWSSCFMRLMF